MKSTVLALLMAAAQAFNIGAAAADEHQRFESVGKIDAIDLDTNLIVIDDTSHTLGDGALIHGRGGHTSSRTRLRVGDKIGTNVSLGRSGQTLYEIWLLPDRYRVTDDQ